MGAISAPSSIPFLKRYLNDSNRSVRETCEIALAKIEWDNSEEGKKHRSTVAPSSEQYACALHHQYPFWLMWHCTNCAMQVLHLHRSRPALIKFAVWQGSAGRHFKRSDRCSEIHPTRRLTPSLRAISRHVRASKYRDTSCRRCTRRWVHRRQCAVQVRPCVGQPHTTTYTHLVHRHEIAFVFGQLLSAHAVPSLVKVLQDSSESDMVRHEAAEALGGIATPEVLPYLREWSKREDSPRVVKESCIVAIDMWEVSTSPCNAVAYY